VSASPIPPQPRRSPLFSRYSDLGAKLTSFSGWEMPLQFQGIRQEHQAVRQQVGVFDISHMGKFILRGGNPLEALDPLVPSDLSRLKPGKARYTLLLNPEGGILDDLIVYCQADDEVVLIVNAATRERDHDWLQAHLPETTHLSDRSDSQVLLALQGQLAQSVLQPLVDTNLAQLSVFNHCQTEIFGHPAFIARTGYTGEDGFEIMLPPEAGLHLWDYLLEREAVPCGLGARDTLRLEAALPLYGQDMNEETTPLEAGLDWLVHLKRKGDFIGRSILEHQAAEGWPRQLVGIAMLGRSIARHDYSLWHEGTSVGYVTSGAPSPTLGINIALGYVPPGLSHPGQALEVEIRGKRHPAEVVKTPFYRRG